MSVVMVGMSVGKESGVGSQVECCVKEEPGRQGQGQGRGGMRIERVVESRMQHAMSGKAY